MAVDIDVLDHVPIPMPDGVCLSARIWRPKTAMRLPVAAILEYIPYRKRDGTIARDSLMHPYMAAHGGYACVRVDMRGSGDSQGVLHDEYTATELDDALSVVNWLTDQPWCNGHIGMMGKSWGAFNSLQVAALAPPALKAIVALYGTTDRYADDIHYKGGCLLGDNLRWGAVMQSFNSRPPDPLVYGEGWHNDWLARMQTEPFLPARWLEHQSRDAYWKHGSICEDYSTIKASVFMIGGHADGYINTVDHVLRHVPSPAYGLIGPWGHQYAHSAAPGPQIGFLQEMLCWWDAWLCDEPTGVDWPKLRIYVQDSHPPARHYVHRPGCWRNEKTWPDAQQHVSIWHLTHHRLSNLSPSYLTPTLIDSPADCGLQVGEYFPMAMAGQEPIPELAGDQREDDAKSVCFDSPALEQSMTIVGRATITLTLSSNVSLGQIAVRLCDVAPNGSSSLVCFGFLNLSMRDSFASPSPLQIDQAYNVTLPLDMTAHQFAAGHRLRVALSNHYWPFIWPIPLQGQLMLHCGHIAFPTRHYVGEQDECAFESVETAPAWQALCHRPDSYNRALSHDYKSGAVTLVISSDGGRFEDAEHGLINENTTIENWTIHPDDAMCASSQIVSDRTMQRGQDWHVRMKASASMYGDRNTFYLQRHLQAWHNGLLKCNRQQQFRIPRLWR